MRRRSIDRLVIEARINKSPTRLADEELERLYRSGPPSPFPERRKLVSRTTMYDARDVEIWLNGVRFDSATMNVPVALVTHDKKRTP